MSGHGEPFSGLRRKRVIHATPLRGMRRVFPSPSRSFRGADAFSLSASCLAASLSCPWPVPASAAKRPANLSETISMTPRVEAVVEGMRGRYAWIGLVVLTALPVVFGSSYVWWPSQNVLDNDGTHGILHVERHVWGAIVMAGCGTLLLITATAYRSGQRWAWYAMFAMTPFYVAVAAIEPDWFFPILFAGVGLLLQWRTYPVFFGPGPSQALRPVPS